MTSTSAKQLTLALLALLFTACSINSPEIFYRYAKINGLQRKLVKTPFLPVILYRKTNIKINDTLHVYLGGDGLPWLNLITIANDPSPRDPLVLEMMLQDKKPTLYLGRPCYQGLAQTPPCNSADWTSGRYSEKIIASMEKALKNIIQTHSISKISLIGFSGGGTLATLLAYRIPQTTTLLTIAGNLDTEAWTDLHNYSPLSDSVNPADLPPLREDIKQIHLQGGLDINIPGVITGRFLQKQFNAKVVHYPTANHNCCWLKYWPAIIERL